MKRKGDKRRLPILTIIVALAAAAMVITGVVSAKYTQRQTETVDITTSKMYIGSNYLTDAATPPTYDVSDWSTDGIQFEIYNYDAMNAANQSEIDVKYKITLAHPDTWEVVSVKNEGGTTLTADEDGYYTIPYGSAAENQKNFVVVKCKDANNHKPDAETITVESAPYATTIKATFTPTVKNAPEGTTTKSDNGEHYTLDIVSNDYSGDVKVSWTGSTVVRPDTNNALMRDWSAGATGAETFDASEFSSYQLIFFTTDKNPDTVFTVEKVSSGS